MGIEPSASAMSVLLAAQDEAALVHMISDSLTHTKSQLHTLRRVYDGDRGDRVIGMRQKDFWALIDLIAGVDAKAGVVAEAAVQLAERVERLEKAATKSQPQMLYRGVYDPLQRYKRGDMVTHGGSLWHCNKLTSSKPGDGDPAWTLAVKRGRDGRSLEQGASA